MNHKKLLKYGMGVLFGTMLLLTACQTKTGNPYLTEEYISERETAQNELNLIETSEIPTMDTVMQRDRISANVMNNVFEGLYRQGENGELLLGMAAEEPEISEDGLTYVFPIKEEALWSNGDPVTAYDFVFSWRRLADPKINALGNHLIEEVVQNATEIIDGELEVTELGVEALDDKTLKVTLANPITYFKNLLTLPVFFPQNESFVNEMGGNYATSGETLIYNGPFTLNEWDGIGLSWVYERNDQYWDREAVKLNTINVDVVKETSTAVNLYKNDAVDQVTLTGNYIEQEKNHPELENIPTSAVYYLKLNQERDGEATPLANKNIRTGIAKAIDKTGFIDQVLKNGSTPADGLVPEGFAFSPETEKDFRKQNGHLLTYHIDEAREAFQHGLNELGVESITLEIIGDDTQIGRESLVYLQDNLMDILPDLTINISNQPFYARLDADEKQDYDIQLAGWGADIADPINFLELFTTHSGNNRTGFSSEQYDSLIETAEYTEVSDTERWNMLLEAERLLMEEAVIAPIYQEYKTVLQKAHIDGMVSHSVGPEQTYKWANKSK